MTSAPRLYDRLARDLRAKYENDDAASPATFRIPTSVYTDATRFEAERDLLRRLPITVGLSSQIAEPGACLVHDALGVPILVLRQPDGSLRAMLNVCRHRGTRLLDDSGPCRVGKALHCPYHGWTYDLAGGLQHVRKPHLFPGLDRSELGLAPVPVTERYGLVWVVASPRSTYDFDPFLDPLEEDLADLHLDTHVVFRRATTTKRANWKIVMEAFLDAYHVRVLHKNTVAPYFKGHRSVSERAGPHIRSMVGRSGFVDAMASPETVDDVRTVATPTYVFFPNTVFVVQPGFVSRATVYPTAVDEILWEHDLIIPEHPKTEKARAHWEHNFHLIQNGVFDAEDLWICEQIQKGLTSGANDCSVYGGEESAVRSWHLELLARLDMPGALGPR